MSSLRIGANCQSKLLRVRRADETLVPRASTHSCTHVDELGTNQVHPLRKLNSTNRTHLSRAHSSDGFSPTSLLKTFRAEGTQRLTFDSRPAIAKTALTGVFHVFFRLSPRSVDARPKY